MDGYSFWKRFDQLRPKEDLKTFAKRNNLDYVRLTNQRSDCRIPKLEDAYQLSVALGCSMESLITGQDERKPNPRIEAIAQYLDEHPEKLDAIEVLLFEKNAGLSSKSS